MTAAVDGSSARAERLHRPLRHVSYSVATNQLAPHYDVVIVGAGVGGLSCGAFLAKAGARVLVVERHYRPGGQCSYFKRPGPFYFDAGAHFFGSLGNPRAFGGLLLRSLALATEFIPVDPVEIVHFPGEVFELPANIEDHIALLQRRFPHEAPALRRFFDDLLRLYLHLRRGRGDSELIRSYEEVRYVDHLDRTFSDPYLKSLLATTYGFIGRELGRLSLLAMTAMMMSYLYDGGYVVRGGSQCFADGLLLRFVGSGGQLVLNQGVRAITTHGDRATGVELDSGQSIGADFVVSNADALATFHDLLGAERVEPSYLARLGEQRKSNSCFVLYLGLRSGPEAVRGARGWHWSNRDLRERTTAPFYVATPTLADPSLCPPGCQIVTATMLAGEAESTEVALDDDAGWARYKDQQRQAAMARLEQILPGVGEAIVVQDAATPRTILRYTQSASGCMYGWESSPEQTWPRRLPIETPISNLFLCGHWSATGPGVLSVVANAWRTANLIEGRLGAERRSA